MNIFRIGHIGLPDALPLLLAESRGFFAEEKVALEISNELGLAAICSKLAEGKLDGACLPATLPVLLSVGLGLPRVGMKVVVVTAYEGLAICLGPKLSAPTPGAKVTAIKIGVTAHDPATRLLAQTWLQKFYPTAMPEVTWLPLPASQLVDFLHEGIIDVFCGPRILAAVAHLRSGARVAAESATYFPKHLTSVVALRQELWTHHSILPGKISCGLERAKSFCQTPDATAGNARLLAHLLPTHELTKEQITTLAETTAQAFPTSFTSRVRGKSLIDAKDENFLISVLRLAAGPYQHAINFKDEVSRAFNGD